MRALLVTLALTLLSACALSPAQHALVYVAANDAVASVGDVVQREMADDYTAIGGGNASEADLAKFDAHWDPVLAHYAEAEKALDAYEARIRAAELAHDASLLEEPARAVLGAWAHLGAVTDQLGIPLPAPPAALVKLAGGAK